jgi:hypothetical protein
MPSHRAYRAIGGVAACVLLLLNLLTSATSAPAADAQQQRLARRLMQQGSLFKNDLVNRRFRFFNSFARWGDPVRC